MSEIDGRREGQAMIPTHRSHHHHHLICVLSFLALFISFLTEQIFTILLQLSCSASVAAPSPIVESLLAVSLSLAHTEHNTGHTS